jgi:hypothetical protein
MHEENRTRFSEQDVQSVWESGFSLMYKSAGLSDLLWELQWPNSVVYYAGEGEYTLGHLSYQEFLTAQEIVNKQDPRFLINKFNESWWRQVLVFYAGIAGNIERLFRLLQASRPVRKGNQLIAEMSEEARFSPPALKDFLAGR